MKRFRIISVIPCLLILLSILVSCVHKPVNQVSSTTFEEPKTITLEKGSVKVYEINNIKLHAYKTNDPLSNECFVVEGKKSLIGIENPAFHNNLKEWKQYIVSLNKPLAGIFVSDHPTGGDYWEGFSIYSSKSAKAAIEKGATGALAKSMVNTFGNKFDANLVSITNIVPAGKTSVGGLNFIVIDEGTSFSLVIPAINCVYTHMLGGNTHSILAGADHINATLKKLKSFQNNKYKLILSSHSEPETQEAVSKKISYVNKVKELSASVGDRESFIKEMNSLYPDYTGQNYLKMTANYLFP